MKQITQDGHILRPGVGKVFLIYLPHTAVDYGFLYRLQAVLAAHHDIAEGEQEVHFQRERAFIIAVIQVEVHRIDVLFAGGGNLNDLSLQPLDQGEILRLRVADDDIIVRDQEHVQNLPLGGEGLAAAGSA